MTVDERLEFLLKSTESLHASSHELHSSMTEVRVSVAELRATIQQHTKQFAIQAESIRQLAIVAAAHGDRTNPLERKTGT